DLFAAACVDAHVLWDWSAPVSKREKQLADAVGKLPRDYFAPFSKAAASSVSFSGDTQCLWWEKSGPSEPVAPKHARYPTVPTLVMGGDLDFVITLDEVSEVAE